MRRNLFGFVGLLSTLAAFNAVTAIASTTEKHEEGVSPETALHELAQGNERFLKGKLKHNHQDEARREGLAKGQKPHTIILSCSDSRVPPEIVFDQGLGDLFVVRTAGHTVGSDAVASIEYAVEHLGSKLLIVMGHESCGAVKAALQTPIGQSAGSYDLDNLVGKIRPHVHETGRSLASDERIFRRPVQANVDAVSCGLIKRSKILREHFKKGELKIQPAIYGLGSGKVDFWSVRECDAEK